MTIRKMHQLATVSTSSGRPQKKTPLMSKRQSAPRRSTKRESRMLKKPFTSIPSGMFRSANKPFLRLSLPIRVQTYLKKTQSLKYTLAPKLIN